MIPSRLRMLPALAFAGAALLANADSLDVVSAQQTSPGNVSVTVAFAGAGRLQPRELSLELDGSRSVPVTEIAASRMAGSPGWLVLCLDRSGSVGPAAFGSLKTALNGALAAQGSRELGYKVAVVSFGSRTAQAIGFTSQTPQVTAAIDRLRIEPGGKTRLHDAIAGALATLRAEGDGRKRLLVASDGKDVGSTLSARRLAELAQEPPSIPIDALSFGALAPGESDSLSLLAGATGGRFVQVTDPAELPTAVRTLLAGNAPAQLLDLAFAYAAASDRQSESATLLYAAEGHAPIRRPLGITVAALAPAQAQAQVQTPPPVVAPADTARNKEEPGASTSISVKFILWLRALPLLYWLIGLAVVLLLAVLAWRRSREREEAVVVVTTSVTPVAPPTVAPPVAPPRRSATVVGHAWMPPRPGQPTAVLRGVSGALRGQQYGVEKAAFRVGCAPDNDLVIVGDDFASSHHALLRYEANGLYVEDLGSTNGSKLNGAPFKSATRSLAPGDELQFGHTTLEVRVAGGGMAPAPANPGFEPRVN